MPDRRLRQRRQTADESLGPGPSESVAAGHGRRNRQHGDCSFASALIFLNPLVPATRHHSNIAASVGGEHHAGRLHPPQRRDVHVERVPTASTGTYTSKPADQSRAPSASRKRAFRCRTPTRDTRPLGPPAVENRTARTAAERPSWPACPAARPAACRRPEFFRILLRGRTGHAERLRRVQQPADVPNHPRSVGHHRQQPLLHVDHQQRGFLGVHQLRRAGQGQRRWWRLAWKSRSYEQLSETAPQPDHRGRQNSATGRVPRDRPQ